MNSASFFEKYTEREMGEASSAFIFPKKVRKMPRRHGQNRDGWTPSKKLCTEGLSSSPQRLLVGPTIMGVVVIPLPPLLLDSLIIPLISSWGKTISEIASSPMLIYSSPLVRRREVESESVLVYTIRTRTRTATLVVVD